MSGYQQFSVTIRAAKNVPLLMHNGQMVDPRNEYAKQMKEITSKRVKTDADHERIAEIEMAGGLYLDEELQVILPSTLIEAAITDGAKKSKKGKESVTSVFVDESPRLEYERRPRDANELLKSDFHRDFRAVRIGQAKTMRARPIFKNWSATFTVSLLTDISNASDLQRWIADAGIAAGIGDFRPRYGRFVVENFSPVT